MRIKKSLSIQPNVLDIAQVKADEFFGGNFSSYVTYLINCDVKGQATMSVNSYVQTTPNFPPPKVDLHKKEVSMAIDNILNME